MQVRRIGRLGRVGRVGLLALMVLAAACLSQVAAAGPAAAASGPPTPTPLTPANGASVTVPLTLSWSAVTDAAGLEAYNWRVSPSSSMAPIVAQSSPPGTQTSDTLSGLANGTYFWQVQAVDNNVIVGAFTAPQGFTVTGANPGELPAPTLNPPQTGATSFHPFFLFEMSWNAVPGATGYHLEFDGFNSTFDVIHKVTSPVACVSGLDVLGFPPSPPPPAGTCAALTGNFAEPGTYFYRVQAVNASGALSVPSNLDAVTISYNAPLTAPPQPAAPATGTTVSFPFSVSFANVPIPQLQGYEVQFSTTSSFNSIEFDVPLIDPGIPFATRSGSTSSLTLSQGLVGGTTFWRVRATEGDASATTAAVTAFSSSGSFIMSSAPPAVVSVTAANPTLSNGASSGAQVQLSADVGSGGSVVKLTSSNPAALSVPASLTIAPFTQTDPFIGAGVATGTFQYQAGTVATPTPVTVTATLGSSSATATVTVEPPVLQQLTLDPTTVPGGEPPTAIVELSGAAPSSGAVVSLSSDSTAVQVPGTVTIPAGRWSSFVNLTTSAVTANTTATVTATYAGITLTSQLNLTPQQPPASVSLSPTSTTGTNGSSGVVQLQSPAAADGAFVALASSNPAAASVPPFVTIGQFGTGGGFNVATTQVSTQTSVTISATAAGVTVSTTLTLTPTPPPPPPTLALTVNPSSIPGGNTSVGTATLGATAPAGGTSVTLTSGNTVASVPASVVIAAGQTSATFTITTAPVSNTIVFNVSATANGITAFAPLTLTPTSTGLLSSLTLSPTSVRGGNSSTGTVRLTQPAPAGGQTITLTSDNSTVAMAPGSVTVPSGATSVTFTVTTPPVSSDTRSVISGSDGTTRSATLTVTRR